MYLCKIYMRYTKYVYSKLSSLTTPTFYAQALGVQQICNFFIAMANCASVSAAKSLLSKTYKTVFATHSQAASFETALQKINFIYKKRNFICTRTSAFCLQLFCQAWHCAN